jgi:two-component system cell cycle sensor histidine kinase/response regulator CckA
MSAGVLVVDDDELVRSGLRINLLRAGYRVRTASSAAEALAMMAAETPDIVLCDLVLGDGDGVSILREASQRWPNVPMILITAHGSIHNALEALRAGARDYIQKPANPEEVAHRIRSVLDQEALRRSLASERARADARRRETDEQLARAERMASLGLLAEGAATHLEAILRPLADMPARLGDAAPGSPAIAQLARELDRLSRQAASVLEDLRTIGQTGQVPKIDTSVSDLLADFARSPEFARIRRAHPQVRIELHPGVLLPSIPGSPAPLAQMIENLLLNACESASPAGHVDLTLVAEQVDNPVGRYGRGNPGQYVVLRIRDSGPTLSDEDAERFFEPFYAARHVGRKEVTGLGLSMALRIVADHGGYINLTHEGVGNTFHVYLPAAGRVGESSSATWSGTELVLVVDDQETHRQHARALLEGFGYQVLTAGCQAEAVDLCQRQRRDGRPVALVVMDLLLGGELDGVDVVRLLRDEQPSLRVLLVSGFADTARIAEARKLGFRHWVQKPLSGSTLGKAVRKELDQPG